MKDYYQKTGAGWLAVLLSLVLWAGAISPSLARAGELTNIDEYLKPQETRTISMDFKDAQLNDVLKVLSQQSDMNFIASQEVSGKTVTIYLDKVPIEEALERILASNNLTYEVKPGSNIFLVYSLQLPAKQLVTRMYRLSYATVMSSKLNQTLSGGSSGGGFSGAGSGESGIAAAVKAVLSPDGKIIEDSRTNSLIVTDIPSQFAVIEQTVARLDVRVPQILIEVEMLDISKSTADLLGAKFGDTPFTFMGAERDTLYPFDRNKAMANAGKKANQGFTFGDVGDEYRVGTLSFAGLTMTLQFLRTRSDTKNLARPRILTLNNETAEINIKTNEAIGLASVTTSSQSNSITTAQAERTTTGVFLKVTPQVNLNSSEITMAIEPKVIQARTGQTFSGQTFKDPEERGTKSVLRIPDGDTIILGGLLRTNEEETKTSVPVLGDLPVVGAAFRHKDKTASQRELIIFITPHILQESFARGVSAGPFAGAVRQAGMPPERVEEINKELSRFESRNLN
ncbi:MAG: secretin and TonB N-terminal domain-containing protein [Candidatus Omnitrophica bacterium]|nr:secretin and TonB N-terminal domain-containing protein [Candidatus Omnitrophota bacterium]